MKNINYYLNPQTLTTTDLLLAFFSGVGATIIGFFLTMIWEWYKLKNQENAVFDSLKEELKTNKAILNNNIASIIEELRILDEGKSVVSPLNIINADFTNMLFVCIPKKIRKDTNLLSELRTIAMGAKVNNETLKSRETYRMNNEAMTNYSSRMKIYDQILQIQTNELITKIEAFLSRT